MPRKTLEQMEEQSDHLGIQEESEGMMMPEPKITPSSDSEWKDYYRNQCAIQRDELKILVAQRDRLKAHLEAIREARHAKDIGGVTGSAYLQNLRRAIDNPPRS